MSVKLAHGLAMNLKKSYQTGYRRSSRINRNLVIYRDLYRVSFIDFLNLSQTIITAVDKYVTEIFLGVGVGVVQT